MVRYRIDLSYKGTLYHGWQVQNNASTVQGELNRALGLLLRETIETVGCGRTDTGVHAHSYTAHFECSKVIDSLSHACYKLNCILPHDIAINSLLAVPNTFHARFDAIARTYQYFVNSQKEPFRVEYSYFYPHHVDLEKMNEAAKLLLGKQDFTSFSKLHTDVKTNICTVHYAQWQQVGHGRLVFTICADRFLRNMVRAIVGTLLEIGRGRRSLDDLRTLIIVKDRNQAGISVPAQGLFLWKTDY